MSEGKLAILVVEDDDGTRECLDALLSSAGHSVYLCSTRARAESLLRHGGFDFVLTDGLFPEDDLLGNVRPWGLLLCVECAIRGIPVVLMTASNELADQVRRYGFKVVMKPFSPTEMLNMVVEQMEAQRSRG